MMSIYNFIKNQYDITDIDIGELGLPTFYFNLKDYEVDIYYYVENKNVLDVRFKSVQKETKRFNNLVFGLVKLNISNKNLNLILANLKDFINIFTDYTKIFEKTLISDETSTSLTNSLINSLKRYREPSKFIEVFNNNLRKAKTTNLNLFLYILIYLTTDKSLYYKDIHKVLI